MTHKVSIRLRACFLLMVFSINTVVGFACAIGVDNGKTSHHAETEIPGSAHSHDHGHGEQPGHHDDHGDGGSQSPHHGDTGGTNSGDEDDCCSDDVAKLLKEEKNIAKTITIDHPVLASFYPAPLYNVELSFYHGVTRHTRYFVRNYHPPIPDIRIAIQSFQI